jgi:hypothetical protein
MTNGQGSVIQGRFLQGLPQLSAPQPQRTAPPFMAGPRSAGPVVQRLANGAALQLPAHLAHFGSGSGQRLPAVVQQKMEAFFKTSFADVRVHVGPQAATIGALAFTQGANLFFAPGQYDPSTSRGQQLLGHELTHVVQQRAGRVRNPLGAGVAIVQDHSLEAEAERMGLQAARYQLPVQAKLAASTPPAPGRAGVTIQLAELPKAVGYGDIGKNNTPEDLAEAARRANLNGQYTGHLSKKKGAAVSPQTQTATKKLADGVRAIKQERKDGAKKQAKQSKADGYGKKGCKADHAALKRKKIPQCGMCGADL